MLQEAKELCDYLIVGLQVDPSMERKEKNKPIQSLFERYIQLSACKYVDEIIPYVYESEIIDIILTINPDIRICGEEYKNKAGCVANLYPTKILLFLQGKILLLQQ